MQGASSLHFFPILSLLLLLFTASGGVAAESVLPDQHDRGKEEVVAGAEETIWTCSMHPQIQLPESGQCPICFMDLIEITKESDVDRQNLRQITFNERARKIAQVEVQTVVRGQPVMELRMVGKVDYDETRVGAITSWVNGRIDKLFVDYTGSHVKRGQAMAKVYSPELLTTQVELIQALAAFKRTGQSGNEIIRKTATRTLEASREKLRLLGLSQAQLQAIEKSGEPSEHLTLTAPLSGVVIKKAVTEGMYVQTGSPIYTVADLSHVWVVLEAYESDIQAVALGQQVYFTVESYPGTSFLGEVAYIDPLVDRKTRTIRIRLNVANRDAMLKPGMFVRAISSSTVAEGADKNPLLIPASAPLLTGKRALVYVQVPEQAGKYVGREVVLGQRHGDFYQVKSGLQEGELVVTHGNFKIDSAIQLQGRPSLMNPYREDGPTQDEDLPLLFVSRLDLLNRSFAELSKVMHGKDSHKQKEVLHKFRNSLLAIKAESLDGDIKLSWQELSMLLSSDLLLLQEAENARETKYLYVTLAEHFHQLRHRFALNDASATRLGSADLRMAITSLLARYFELHQHLSADDLEGARRDSMALSSFAETVAAGLGETGLDVATTMSAHLTGDVRRFETAKTLEEIRVLFYPLSRTLSGIVETFGSSDGTSVYIQFCPMAFGNKGATWLAGSEEINNPYFGAMMLRCGEVRQQIQD